MTIQRIIPTGPAARGGQLKAGDRILAVGEGDQGPMTDVVGAQLHQVVARIRGNRGSVVRLRVLPADRFESAVYAITRDNVETNNLAGAVLSGEMLPEGRKASVGYVYMPTFYVDREARAQGRDDYRSSTRDLEKLLRDFSSKRADVVVLDMCDNDGGVLLEAIEMSGLFLEKGPVVQVKDRNGKVDVYSPRGTSDAWRGPLVVLTSKRTARGCRSSQALSPTAAGDSSSVILRPTGWALSPRSSRWDRCYSGVRTCPIWARSS